MKIAIIATGRSRSILLSEIIGYQNPTLRCLYEQYTYDAHDNISVQETTSSLKKEDNFIVKIMGHNLTTKVEDFNLYMYDQIYFIERHDFFEQCSSLQVAITSKHWMTYGHDRLGMFLRNKRRYHLTKELIVNQATYISNYMKFKLAVKNPTEIVEYNDAILLSSSKRNNIMANNFNYSQMITNYQQKQKVNEIFDRYFDYRNSQCCLDEFISEINLLDW
jgi:hypothetical protein